MKQITSKEMEKYSSAFTLSDMEIFIFPELLYALVLANIMSPIIWEWREAPWFKGMEKKSPMQRIQRVKQYIMDHFVFNLDLETWGLTTQETELERFKDFIDRETLAKSNALFGYEGDKYYFSIDIRKHFGLDKYDSDIIPYWKTETIEAMEAFKHKKGYTTGAGECVSLSTLYSAAMFIVARIPLDDIYLMATPLHSQNYLNVGKGVLTNNRRIVTKNMWFNGTTFSDKARRALENEQVTIVSHITGYIHSLYKEATIDKEKYNVFKKGLSGYLKGEFSPEMMINFLRKENEFQHCFQYCVIRNNKKCYIEVEKIFQYEHSSSNSFSTDSRVSLLNEIEMDEYNLAPVEDRIILNDINDYIKEHNVSTHNEIEKMINGLIATKCSVKAEMFDKLADFLHVEPRLPHEDIKFEKAPYLSIDTDISRKELIKLVLDQSDKHPIASLALYAYRDMENIDWEPYINASVQRNPVCIEALKKIDSIDEIYAVLRKMPDESIYSDKRLAMPDEIWNYQRGDGIEKGILLANIIKNRDPEIKIEFSIKKKDIVLKFSGRKFNFTSSKNLTRDLTI